MKDIEYDDIDLFEESIAAYFGAPYAVATDSCTHAIELCFRYLNSDNIKIPKNTYISIPFTAMKLNLNWEWISLAWEDFHYLDYHNKIIDAAVYWKEKGYIPGSHMCLSFQYKKHLSLSKGGMVLCPDYISYINIKKMGYDGRMPNTPWAYQNIDRIGYHYNMTPETARLGLEKISQAIMKEPRKWTWEDYPDLTKMKVFQNG